MHLNIYLDILCNMHMCLRMRVYTWIADVHIWDVSQFTCWLSASILGMHFYTEGTSSVLFTSKGQGIEQCLAHGDDQCVFDDSRNAQMGDSLGVDSGSPRTAGAHVPLCKHVSFLLCLY